MIEKSGVCLWDPNETIYFAGDVSVEAFLILEGVVEIFTADGLLLNRIGKDEIFGETSLLLDECRSVSARAGSAGAKTKNIPKSYFSDLMNKDAILSAVLRKTQHRLKDSNDQSNELANELDKVSGLLETHFSALDSVNADQDEHRARISAVQQKVRRFQAGQAIAGGGGD